MASKRKDPHAAFVALIAALCAANDAKEETFDDDIMDLKDAFNKVGGRL